MTWDPSITQKVRIEVESTTDQHRLKDLLWRAIEHNSDGLHDMDKRMRAAEVVIAGRFTQEAGEKMINEKIDARTQSMQSSIRHLDRLFYGAIAALLLDIAVRLLH